MTALGAQRHQVGRRKEEREESRGRCKVPCCATLRSYITIREREMSRKKDSTSRGQGSARQRVWGAKSSGRKVNKIEMEKSGARDKVQRNHQPIFSSQHHTPKLSFGRKI